MDSDVHSESSTSFGDVNDSTDENDVMEKCCFGKQVFAVPQAFCVEEEVFNEVLSMGTWQNVLTDKHREKLKKLLPTFPENDEEEKLATLKSMFSGENFKFGNPSKHFFNRLKDGFLTPEVAEVSSALKKASFREYKNQQQQYYYHLLQEILISRKKLLDTAYTLPPDHPVKMQQFTAKPKDATLCERTRLRYFSILQDLREECGEMDTSSEDENYPESSPPKVTRKHKKQLQILEASLSPEMTRITSTTAFPPGYPGSGHFLNRCFDMIEVSEERYREMLLTHKQRRLTEQDHPELDVSKIVLEDMIVRANIAKRPLTKIAESQMKKKCKTQETSDKIQKLVPVDAEKCSLDVKSPVPPSTLPQQEDSSLATNGDAKQIDNHISAIQENDVQPEQVTIKVEIEEDQSCENRLASSPCDVPQYPTCFFSLVRDLFCESGEQKLSAVKLEERVRTWQEGSTSIIFDWISFQESWADLVSSALKFLAGDLISILPENFVPFLDYKEKQQQWQWIGSGRDAEEQLFTLCQHWLENKDDVSLDVLETSQGSPPPPRVTTVWTVRPTSEEERKVYREQECVRYQNPHKAFTFKVHGYESVVGPVKGVYGKESGVNKAREHSLLISDRPPFVTILSLVRDAAARLPNGEGTRADICELLKDSQYLAPASDQQIHTVVSGALDRLHYEKDPCVKYDVNRKLWIYLHRNRTEEEFERIHQAQAAAAKARKAVQKIKLPKIKSKDVPRTPPSVSISSTSENGASVLNIDVTTSVSPSPSLQSPRGGTSPRTQGSPKQSHPSSNRHLIRSLSMPSQANSKNPATVITECYNAARKQEIPQGAILQSSAVCQPTVTSSTPVSSPQHSNTSNILPQFQNEGNNSRPPSQGSVQSLPSPKTVIANVNAAQFVSVGSLQVASSSIEQSMPSPTVSSRLHGVLSVDMKPSSPSFVGQPPVLQPVLSHQSVDSTTTLTCVSSAVAPNLMSAVPGTVSKAGNSATFATQNISNAKTVQGFQTIVIKQDPGPRTGNSISSLPLLSVEEISSTTDSSALNSSPVVARLVHGSQLLSLSNIVAGAAAASNSALKQGPASIQNFKIQGSNFSQQIVPTSALNLLPATQITASGDIKLPRLALVSQQSNVQEAAMISSGSIIGQSKVFSVNQDVIQSTEVKDSLVHKDLSEAKIATLPAQTFSGIRPNISSDISQIIGVTSTPNHIVSSSAISSSCTVSNPSITSVSKNSPVVIAPQEALKPITPTYVMTAPVTSASVITTQQGVRTAAPLSVRALQGIKVIPVPQTLGANKNVRTQPLLARIIAPPSGIALRSATVSSDLVHAHQLKGSSVNIVHGLRSVTPSSHIKKATAQTPTASQEIPSSQPFIIQVQAPKVTEQEDINLYPKEG